jgi:hypothetical protein
LLSLKFKKGEDLSELELRITLLELKYGIPLNKEMKIAAVMKAAKNEYSATIQSETQLIVKPGGIVTYNDQIQALTQRFRIYGKSRDDSDSDEDKDVALSVVSFKGKCNICGKEGHKASKCPKKKSVECEHCGKSGHKKESCWLLLENKSKQPEWSKSGGNVASASIGDDDNEIIL